MSTVLQEQGMSEAGANAAVSALAQGAALGIGAVAGGTSGAATALAVDTNNRQLHPIELKWVGTSAKDFAAVLSDKYGRPVSELDAMRLLTYAGETDVDKDNQNVVSNILFGPGYMQETQMLLDAKKYIVQNAKGTFVDEAGKTQKLFVATGQDRINPVMYAEYKNNAAYRDFYWTVTSTNLLPSNPTAQEKAVYDARESARLVAGGKNILFSLGPAVIGVGIQAGRTALSSQLGSKAEMVPPVQAAPEVITAAGKIEPLPKKLNIGANSTSELTTQTAAGQQGSYAQTNTTGTNKVIYVDSSGAPVPLKEFQPEIRTSNGIALDIRLPDPVAGLDYIPKTLASPNINIASSHLNGYTSELTLANAIASMPNQTVLKYGDAIGAHGADVISVNNVTGEVSLWDSKYRSADVLIGESPTFTNASAMNKATAEAIDVIRKSNLPANIKQIALSNLQNSTFTANTVGGGSAKSSSPRRYCNGNPC